MKKKIIFNNKIWIVLIAMLAMLLVFPISSRVAHADTQVVSTDMDNNLFNKLARLRGTNYLKTESFNSEKYEKLDLSGEQLISDTSTNIEDIAGLTKFKFNFTKELNLSHHSITEVPNDVLKAFPKLETLIISNNQIEDIDLTGCYNLRVLIADNNLLTRLDATDMYATDGLIDLSANMFTDVKNITTPKQAVNVNMTIKLYNNNIQEYDGFEQGYNVLLGLQGLQSKSEKIELKQKMAYFKADNSQRMKVVITQNGEEKYSFIDTEIEEEKIDFDLDYGTYEVSYYYVNDDMTLAEASVKRNTDPTDETFFADNDYFKYYSYKEFKVVPSTPTYLYVFGDKTYTEAEVENIKKTCKIEVTADAESKVYYKMSGGDWKEGSTIPIKRGGKYTIRLKSISLDEKHESEEVTIFINASPNLRIPSILIAVLIIMGSVALFGIVLPLIKKYVL